MPQLLVSHLATTELKLDAHFVAFREKVLSVRDFDEVVVRVDADPELHLLQLATLLVLVGFLLVLLLNVFEFTVVDDLAYGRFGVRSDLNKIKAALFGDTDGLCSRKDAQLMTAILLHHTHLRRTYAFVDAGLIDKASIRPVAPARAIATTWTKCSTVAGSRKGSCWTRRA